MTIVVRGTRLRGDSLSLVVMRGPIVNEGFLIMHKILAQ